ncbi:MAG: HAMP domain-containing histidine kinase [Acholeplasmataceae bacterium]|jgi:two-component system sensor histidine kinase CssS|nr:HAMP domain-containing histidine kinase [Acholeplasmataceae bacterium]
MKRWRLTTQLNIVFTSVIIIVGALFLLIFEVSQTKIYEAPNVMQLEVYLKEVVNHKINDEIIPSSNPYNGYFIMEYNEIIIEYMNDPAITYPSVISNYGYKVWDNPELIETTFDITTFQDKDIYVKGQFIGRDPNDSKSGELILVFTDRRYEETLKTNFFITLQITFFTLMIFGNLIILLWSRMLVGRIEILQYTVLNLSKSDYKKEINIDGSDEIAKLGIAVERMRQEIVDSERMKQEMLQNISHDFKTPITVIQTYAEAIEDGITDVKDINIIIEQAKVLNHRVVQLLEYSKLEYLKDSNKFTTINVKNVCDRIVNNYKYKFSNITAELDSSTYFGIEDNLEVAIANIVDNSIRYAKSEIKIKLADKKLTIFNDGEPIEDKILENLFTPYQKGNKGQFGLGLSISKTTLNHFELNLRVENIPEGVIFTIEPI